MKKSGKMKPIETQKVLMFAIVFIMYIEWSKQNTKILFAQLEFIPISQ